MDRAPVLLALIAATCGADPEPVTEADPLPQFPRLPDADADSPVRIDGVNRLCDRIAAGRGLPEMAIAYTGQRLIWRGIVQGLSGRRLVLGVDRLRVTAILDGHDQVTFEPGIAVEVNGVIESIDCRDRVVVLGPESTARTVPQPARPHRD